jgi:hypothetical protein
MGEFTHPDARSDSVSVGVGGNRQLVHAVKAVELPTTALQIGDITWMMHVPAGAVIVDGFMANDDLETSTLLTVNVGDSTTTNLFFSATTTPQSAGASTILGASRYTKFASATRIKMTVATSAGTPVAGTFILGLTYFVDPEFNSATGVTPITIS